MAATSAAAPAALVAALVKRPWKLLTITSPGNYYSYAESTWMEFHEPCCGVCGLFIEKDPNAKEFFRKVDGFTPEQGNPYYIKISHDDIQGHLAAGECNWKSIYRAIVMEGPNDPFLSGVSYRHSGFCKKGGYQLGVPRNSDDVFLVRNAIHPRNISWFNRPARWSHEPFPVNCGFPIHECCYQLLTKFYAPEHKIKRNTFRLLVAFAREHCTKIEDFSRFGPPPEGSEAWKTVQYDPLFITNYYEALERSLECYQRGLRDGVVDSNPGVMTQMGFYISPGSFSRVSEDIAQMILDLLDGADWRRLILGAGFKNWTPVGYIISL
ncbi:hypothetical protein TSTA_105850 [Talaromyces stipitatus ATCC 10500]|uniref:Uncharacterized protein n=1 Tax=Talaromyces stipitatus (strain ATCC 10500 / CBS 375.48 / QM 6759 / NRRL 1006) TaxID=441959 RepID=B8MPD5_TALSN|nr:uncharacterized protein TSTA_105850 [Talaromyces stipitatus ATCC 10500]EED14374.1 hypothetical protein TSTA_105850 [Talaromyces stipitatus ATCC 10500]